MPRVNVFLWRMVPQEWPCAVYSSWKQDLVSVSAKWVYNTVSARRGPRSASSPIVERIEVRGERVRGEDRPHISIVMLYTRH